MNVRSSFKDLVLRFLVEFAVIVVGVLVALGIDSWASDQAVRSEEVDAKRLLRAEFLSNLARLDTARVQHERTLDAGYDLLAIMNRVGEPEVSELTPDLVMQFISTWTYDPVLGGLNSLIQSGRLGILQEDSLRVALAGWPDIVTDLRENENEEWRLTFQVLNPLLVEIGLAEDLFGAAGRLRRIDLTSGAPDLRPLLSDPRFRHLCATRIMNLHDVLDEVRSVEESAQDIIELLGAP